jgi:S-adenosyl-L-methionine hydrolase (adenosine-forming)
VFTRVRFSVTFDPRITRGMLITLTSDFGAKDAFVSIMKGVIAQINPHVTVVDLTHGIPPQDVFAAAMVVRYAVGYFPRGTIHVVVVDPGVGSARRPLLIEGNESYFIGPDNGVLSLLWEERQPKRIIHLSNRTYYLQPTSATFHGRDIFAPIAAYVSLGVAPVAFGERVDHFVRIALPDLVRSGRSVTGEIVYIDGFGNLYSNIREQDLPDLDREKISTVLGGVTIRGLARNYAAVEKGQLVALINSWGLLEVAANKDSAARLFHIGIGEKVYVSAT